VGYFFGVLGDTVATMCSCLSLCCWIAYCTDLLCTDGNIMVAVVECLLQCIVWRSSDPDTLLSLTPFITFRVSLCFSCA